MNNIKVEQNGKKLILTINMSKVIDTTQSGSERVAHCQWETIPGTDLSLLLQLIKKKAKSAKKNATVEEPAKAEPVKKERTETKEERKARKARKAQNTTDRHARARKRRPARPDLPDADPNDLDI